MGVLLALVGVAALGAAVLVWTSFPTPDSPEPNGESYIHNECSGRIPPWRPSPNGGWGDWFHAHDLCSTEATARWRRERLPGHALRYGAITGALGTVAAVLLTIAGRMRPPVGRR